MSVRRIEIDRIERLAEDVKAKILGKRGLIAEAEGKIVIEAFPKGDGFEIKLTVTTR